jgi:hypothetical protein
VLLTARSPSPSAPFATHCLHRPSRTAYTHPLCTACNFHQPSCHAPSPPPPRARLHEVLEDAGRLLYQVGEGDRGEAAIYAPALDDLVSPEELSSWLLRHLIAQAEQQLQEAVTGAVSGMACLLFCGCCVGVCCWVVVWCTGCAVSPLDRLRSCTHTLGRAHVRQRGHGSLGCMEATGGTSLASPSNGLSMTCKPSEHTPDNTTTRLPPTPLALTRSHPAMGGTRALCR